MSLHYPRTCLGIRSFGVLCMCFGAFGVVYVLCLYCLFVCACLMACSPAVFIVSVVVEVLAMVVVIVLVGGSVVVIFVIGGILVLGVVVILRVVVLVLLKGW